MGDPLTLALAVGDEPTAPELSEPWVTEEQLAGCTAGDSVDLASVCRVASEILFVLSGKQFGVRTETVRPYGGAPWCGWATMTAGQEPDWLTLKTPVRRVHAVKIGGVTLDAADYTVYDNAKLVRTAADGHRSSWPVSQRLGAPDTEPDTFAVTFSWGKDVPEAGRVAAAAFACELAKYINRDSACLLPQNTVSVNRRGVSQTLVDPAKLLKAMRTGLYLVDLWLTTVNPNNRRRRAVFAGPADVALMRPEVSPS